MSPPDELSRRALEGRGRSIADMGGFTEPSTDVIVRTAFECVDEKEVSSDGCRDNDDADVFGRSGSSFCGRSLIMISDKTSSVIKQGLNLLQNSRY